MQDALRRAGTSRFSLNATRCAVPIYQRLGFASCWTRATFAQWSAYDADGVGLEEDG